MSVDFARESGPQNDLDIIKGHTRQSIDYSSQTLLPKVDSKKERWLDMQRRSLPNIPSNAHAPKGSQSVKANAMIKQAKRNKWSYSDLCRTQIKSLEQRRSSPRNRTWRITNLLSALSQPQSTEGQDPVTKAKEKKTSCTHETTGGTTRLAKNLDLKMTKNDQFLKRCQAI